MLHPKRARMPAVNQPRPSRAGDIPASTVILPDLPWAVLLGPILHDARPGDSIVVSTDAMRERVEQAVRAAGRDDLVIRQVQASPSAQVA